MKLAPQQLEQHLKKPLAPIYWVSGDETLLVQETISLVRDAALAQGYDERIRITPDANTALDEALHTASRSLSLFATKQFIELDLRSSKLTQNITNILKEYAEQPSDQAVLIIYANKIESKTEQSAWFKALDKSGVTITLWPIPIEQLPQWLVQRAKKKSMNLSLPAATKLAEHVEGNLLAAAQELEKLFLLNTAIDEKTLDAALTDHAHFDIFNLVDSFLSGNNKRTLRILSALKAEDTEPTLILWAITREIRTMSTLLKESQKGIPLANLFNQFRIWEKRQANVRAFLKRYTYQQCLTLLATTAQIDRQIKGMERGNVWDAFEVILLHLRSNTK